MKAPFNTPLEIGIRTLALLIEAYPSSVDLQRLVFFDYLAVHSGDFQGPKSLHAPLPMRSGELAIKRNLVERGLLLLISKGLAERLILTSGFQYIASDSASSFFSMLSSRYVLQLQERSEWVIENYGQKTNDELTEVRRGLFSEWSHEFYPLENERGGRV